MTRWTLAREPWIRFRAGWRDRRAQHAIGSYAGGFVTTGSDDIHIGLLTYADGSKPRDFGLIAEEVEEVFPDLVMRNEAGDVETVQYHKLVPMLFISISPPPLSCERLTGHDALVTILLGQWRSRPVRGSVHTRSLP